MVNHEQVLALSGLGGFFSSTFTAATWKRVTVGGSGFPNVTTLRQLRQPSQGMASLSQVFIHNRGSSVSSQAHSRRLLRAPSCSKQANTPVQSNGN